VWQAAKQAKEKELTIAALTEKSDAAAAAVAALRAELDEAGAKSGKQAEALRKARAEAKEAAAGRAEAEQQLGTLRVRRRRNYWH
jgi:chromosome segregation ATPase